MNKQQLVQILQSCLLKFDGLTTSNILKLNPNYDVELITIGIKLNGYLSNQVK